jgi:hypothetical protein
LELLACPNGLWARKSKKRSHTSSGKQVSINVQCMRRIEVAKFGTDYNIKAIMEE